MKFNNKTLIAIKGTLVSMCARFVGFLFIIVATPKLVDYLGMETYGIWCLLTQLIGLAGFSDLGIGNGLLNRLIYIENSDQQKQYVVSAFYMLFLIAIMLISIGLFSLYLLQQGIYTGKYSTELQEAGMCFLLIFSLALPFSIVQKIQLANLHGVRVHAYEIFEKTSSLLMTLLGIFLKLSLPLLFLLYYLPTFLSQLVNFTTYKKFEYLKLLWRREYFLKQNAKEILNTGKQFLLLSIIYALTRSSDSYLIAFYSNLETVSDFQLPGRVFEIASIIAFLPGWSLWSTIGNAIKHNEREWIIKTQIRAVSIVVLVAGLLILPMLFYGNTILSLWLHKTVDYDHSIYQAYALYTIFNSIFTVLSTYLNVRSFLYQQCFMLLAFGAIGIPLKIFLLKQYGLAYYIYGNSFAFAICMLVPTFYILKKDLYDRKYLTD